MDIREVESQESNLHRNRQTSLSRQSTLVASVFALVSSEGTERTTQKPSRVLPGCASDMPNIADRV
jgi:hypothetical protein